MLFITLQELNWQADEFGLLDRNNKAKFLKEEWRKIHKAKLTIRKECFEWEAEENV